MEFKNKEALNAYLKRTRYLSYLMLAIMVAAVVTTAILFKQLKAKDAELTTANEQLEEQKREFKESRQELMVQNRQMKERLKAISKQSGEEYLVDSLRSEIYDLINTSSASIETGDLSSLSIEELQAKVDDVKKAIADYDEGRRAIVKKMFTSGEQGRKDARVKLQKEYSLDTQLIPDILSESMGKVDLKNQEAYYQIIYLLGQLDDQYLQENAAGLTDFFSRGKQATLHGASTQRNVDALRRRIK